MCSLYYATVQAHGEVMGDRREQAGLGETDRAIDCSNAIDNSTHSHSAQAASAPPGAHPYVGPARSAGPFRRAQAAPTAAVSHVVPDVRLFSLGLRCRLVTMFSLGLSTSHGAFMDSDLPVRTTQGKVSPSLKKQGELDESQASAICTLVWLYSSLSGFADSLL